MILSATVACFTLLPKQHCVGLRGGGGGALFPSLLAYGPKGGEMGKVISPGTAQDCSNTV